MNESASSAALPANRTHTARMVAIVLALAAGFAVVPRVTESCEKSGAVGDAVAADFTAKVVANPMDPSQTTLTLSAFHGRPVLLDFWATWCGPCQAESPIVNRISERFKDKGLVVIGVNTSDADGLAAKFAARKGLSFPIVYDEGDRIAHEYGVNSLPTLIVLSKEGKVVAVRHVTGESELERLVRQVL